MTVPLRTAVVLRVTEPACDVVGGGGRHRAEGRLDAVVAALHSDHDLWNVALSN